MAYSPARLPAVSRETVGTAVVEVNIPDGFLPKLGALILQRSGDSGTMYWGTTSAVTTSTGALVAKGDPGATAPTLIPQEYFDGLGAFYLIASAAGQFADIVIV